MTKIIGRCGEKTKGDKQCKRKASLIYQGRGYCSQHWEGKRKSKR